MYSAMGCPRVTSFYCILSKTLPARKFMPNLRSHRVELIWKPTLFQKIHSSVFSHPNFTPLSTCMVDSHTFCRAQRICTLSFNSQSIKLWKDWFCNMRRVNRQHPFLTFLPSYCHPLFHMYNYDYKGFSHHRVQYPHLSMWHMDCLVHLSLEWTPEQVLNDCFPFRINI